MPPRKKFTREEMIAAGLRIVRARGIEALTAKAMSIELNTSTQPVFTCFGTMDVLRSEVRAAAQAIYDGYAMAGLRQEVPMLGYGMQYIRFAREEPQLYRLLFLTAPETCSSGVMEAMRHSGQTIVPIMAQVYRISEQDAIVYFRSMWLAVHSLSTLIVTGSCPYTDAQIRQMLTGFSLSTCKAIKEIPGFASGDYDTDALFRALTGRD